MLKCYTILIIFVFLSFNGLSNLEVWSSSVFRQVNIIQNSGEDDWQEHDYKGEKSCESSNYCQLSNLTLELKRNI